jgi:hypothetical protein
MKKTSKEKQTEILRHFLLFQESIIKSFRSLSKSDGPSIDIFINCSVLDQLILLKSRSTLAVTQ